MWIYNSKFLSLIVFSWNDLVLSFSAPKKTTDELTPIELNAEDIREINEDGNRKGETDKQSTSEIVKKSNSLLTYSNNTNTDIYVSYLTC